MCYNWHRGSPGPAPWARSLGSPPHTVPGTVPRMAPRQAARQALAARQGAHRGKAVATKHKTLAARSAWTARSAWGAPADLALDALDGDKSLALQLERNRSSDHAISAPGPSRSFLVWKTSRAC